MDPGGPAPKLVGGLGSVYAPFPFGTVAYGARAAPARIIITNRVAAWGHAFRAWFHMISRNRETITFAT